MSKDSPNGVKAVAILEATKGIATLLVCLGLYELIGYNLQKLLIRWATGLSISPDNYYVQQLASEASKVTAQNLYTVIAFGLFYASIRFIESFGLWQGYLWTKWFAVLSGAIYLPFECYEIIKNPNVLSIGILLINLLIVVYVYLNIRSKDDPSFQAFS
jgi:uncharacterized membrane protein (DUF2068 family)